MSLLMAAAAWIIGLLVIAAVFVQLFGKHLQGVANLLAGHRSKSVDPRALDALRALYLKHGCEGKCRVCDYASNVLGGHPDNGNLDRRQA